MNISSFLLCGDISWLNIISGLILVGSVILGAFYPLLLLKVVTLRRGNTDDHPSVLIVIPVREAEQGFEKTVRAAIDQTYKGAHRVLVVVDSVQDAAWAVLRSIDSPHLTAENLQNRSARCSLKNSALIQASKAMRTDEQVMAVLDSDIVPEKDWLERLVSGFGGQVMATCGLRYYRPRSKNLGSMMLHLWSVFGVLAVVQGKILWGGSAAYRKEAMDAIRDTWARTVTDDVSLLKTLSSRGWKHRIVPLVAFSDQGMTLAEFVEFSARQLWLVRVHALKDWIPMIAAPWITLCLWVTAAFIVPWGALVLWVTISLTGIILDRWLSNQRSFAVWNFLVLSPANVVLVCLCSLISLRSQITWRGVRYEKEGRIG